jgi:hypothetical protein
MRAVHPSLVSSTDLLHTIEACTEHQHDSPASNGSPCSILATKWHALTWSGRAPLNGLQQRQLRCEASGVAAGEDPRQQGRRERLRPVRHLLGGPISFVDACRLQRRQRLGKRALQALPCHMTLPTWPLSGP